jgi:hypothetical protein
MQPPRPPGSLYLSGGGRKSGPIGFPPVTFDAAKQRVLAKLEERLDMGASKRMPQSLLRQSLRQLAEQIVEQEARGLTKPDRDRLVEDALRELFGYGPLEELFADPAAREVMVIGPGMVIVRRDLGQWLPTSVKFRDEGHLRATLDRIATHAEPVGPVLASVTLFDVRLPNGFRALALIPPEALGQPATVSFVREQAVPAPAAKEARRRTPGCRRAGRRRPGRCGRRRRLTRRCRARGRRPRPRGRAAGPSRRPPRARPGSRVSRRRRCSSTRSSATGPASWSGCCPSSPRSRCTTCRSSTRPSCVR